MDSLFSKTIKAGKTTYFVDVKEAKNKAKYITLSESSPNNSQDGDKKFNRHRVIIFDRAVEPLRDALTEASDIVKQ